jgi:serine protease Do
MPPVSHQTPPQRRRLATVSAIALAAGLGLSLTFGPLVRGDIPAAPATMTQLPSFAPLVKKVLPAVVNISATQKLDTDSDDEQSQDQAAPDDEDQGPGFPQSPFDEFLRKFFEQQGRGFGFKMPRNIERTALGSGFIIDANGYVVTNNHVVQGADKVTVIFQDETRHPAKVIGRDAKTDLALLKIETDHPLPYVQWGDSDAAQVGDWVLAVGNPFGLGGTVSTGVISARGRDIHSGPYDDFLQIDAAINRGNSGGPTFDLNGKVLGINTAIYSPNGGSVGIGFAIPANLAKNVIDQLRAHGKVERGWLGVQIQQVTPEIAKSLGLPKSEGALVADVTEGGPAASAGFRQGDVILAFNGHDIRKVRDLPIVVAETAVGDKADVKVWRKDHEIDLNPKIAAMPANPEQAFAHNGGDETQEGTAESASTLGLKLAPLTQEWRQRLKVPKSVKGVVVTAISDKSPLAELGIEAGDVIETIDQQPVTSPRDAAAKLKEARRGKNKALLLLVNRHGVNQYIALSMNGDDNG